MKEKTTKPAQFQATTKPTVIPGKTVPVTGAGGAGHQSHSVASANKKTRRTPKVNSVAGKRDTEVVMGFRLLYVLGYALALRQIAALITILISSTPSENITDHLFTVFAGFRTASAGLLIAIGIFGQQLYGGWAARKEEQRIRGSLLRILFQQARRNTRTAQTGPQLGRMVSLLTDSVERLTEYRQNYLGATKAALITPLLVVAYVAIAIDPIIAGAQFLLYLLIPIALMVFFRLFRKTSVKSRQQRARLSGKYLDAISGLTTIQLFGAGPRMQRELAEQGEKNRLAIMRLLASNQIVIILIDGLFALLLVVSTAALTIWRYQEANLALGSVVELSVLVVLLLEPLTQVSGFFYIGMGGKAAQRVIGARLNGQSVVTDVPKELLSEAAAPRAADPKLESSAPLAPSEHSLIQLEQVHVDYGAGPVLNRVNLKILKGDRIGIIGTSGSGKTTLLNVIGQRLHPNQGRVLSHPDQIAYVTQNTWLFTGTIRDNLTMVAPNASEQQLWNALEQANLAAEVRAFAAGLDTELGEGGASISGGQAQRLSLARALLSGRPVLLLDEPTAQIDRYSQSRLIAALAKLSRDYTLIVVTHRLELLALVDKCYRVEKGALNQLPLDHETSQNYPDEKAENNVLGKSKNPATWRQTVDETSTATASFEASTGRCSDRQTPPAPAGQTPVPRLQTQNPQAPSIRSLLRWLGTITSPVHLPLVWSTLFRITTQILDALLFGWLIGGIYGLTTGQFSIPAVFGGLIVLSLGKALTHYLEQFSGHYVAFKALELLRTDLFRRLYPKAPAVLTQTQSGDLLTSATKDIDRIEVFYAHTVAPVASALITPLLVGSTLLYWIDSKLLLLPALAWLVSLAIVPLLGTRSAFRAAKRLLAARRELAQQVTDSLGGIEQVVGYGLEHSRQKQMYLIGNQINRAANQARMVTALRKTLNVFLLFAAMFWVLFNQPITGDTLHDHFVTLLVLGIILRLFQAPAAVEDALAVLDQSYAAAHRLWEINHLPQLVHDGPKTADFPQEITVTWKDVEFSYPQPNRQTVGNSLSEAASFSHPPRLKANQLFLPVLRNLNFTVPAGSWTVIAGVSGSGKSTLAKLLLRYYPPTSGEILLNQQPITDLTLSSLRKTIGYLGQDHKILTGTVRYNLELAAAQATTDQMWHVLDLVQLGDFLRHRAQGLDTFVGERGGSLSGGQVQRLALAQVLLREPRVLVLDEFTANLDEETANRIRRCLHDEYPTMTVIEIAHRTESLFQSDQVVVLDQGQIVAQGTPAQVWPTLGWADPQS